MSYFAHVTATIDEGSVIGEHTKIWHYSHVMSNASIGASCTLGQNVFVASGVRIGRKVKIQNNVSIYEGVLIEDEVFVGPSVVFTNVKNPRSAVSRKSNYESTIVKKGATLGANATILSGVEIGEYAFVGAGSVIIKSVKPYSLVVGNPGKHVGWMSRSGHRLYFNNEGFASCIQEGRRYQKSDDLISMIEE